MESEEIVFIAKDRIAALVGEKGWAKKAIEASGKVKLDINSKTGRVTIKGDDPVDVWHVANVIRAVSRGFPPEIARKLFKPDYTYEIINISKFVRNERDLRRKRGRLIGRNGSARKRLQILTKTQIRVKGKTAAILGKKQGVDAAHQAIIKLLRGSPHQRVFNFLEEQRVDKK